jgi:AraC-like DNA-binding protein
MIHFSYNIASFSNFIRLFAATLHTPLENNMLQMPAKTGQGYIRLLPLPNGAELLLLNFTLNEDVYVKRIRTGDEYYIFTCEEMVIPTSFNTHIDAEAHTDVATSRATMYLVSHLSDYEVHAQPGLQVSSVRVLMSKEWLAAYFQLDNSDDVMLRYLALKTKSILVKEPDYESRQLMNELLRHGAGNKKNLMYYESRLMLIMENFFQWLHGQQQAREFDTKISRSDVESMIAVEKELVKNLSLAPFIEDLSRYAGMSSAKLKKLFKEVYGLPVYQYFQKIRMQKARELLLEGKMPVGDVGLELGYENMSNFSTAFKKQFGTLPSNLLSKKPL